MSAKFFESLEEIAYERGLNIEDVLGKVETAMQVACKNSESVPYKGTIKMEYDLDRKALKFTNYQYIVNEIDPEGPRGQILVEDAKLIKPKAKAGQTIKTKVDLKLFSRKAASMFKQNFMNELKSLERDEAYNYFSEKVGEIITARVCEINDHFIGFDLGKGIIATMSEKDQLPGETYTVDDTLKVYISKVEKTGRGPKVYISRSSKEFVRKLFEINIPEIANGQIEIMSVARDPGKRSKIGVLSVNGDVDPKGACVGAGGLRIKSINAALNGEKIDVFVWKSDPVELISEAISPAKCISVMADSAEKKAIVIVNDDQYSLAIGAKGQNARLAVLATGWKIDFKKLSEASEEGIDFKYNVSH